MNIRAVLVSLLTAVVTTQPAVAVDIYRVQGAHGEASFGDVALPDAVTVDLDVYQPSPQQADSVRQSVEQTVAIAAELEAARLAREQAYAEKRAQAARRAALEDVARAPDADNSDAARSLPGYFFGYGRSHHPLYRPPGRPPHQRPPGGHEPVMPEPEPDTPPTISKPLLAPGAHPGR